MLVRSTQLSSPDMTRERFFHPRLSFRLASSRQRWPGIMGGKQRGNQTIDLMVLVRAPGSGFAGISGCECSQSGVTKSTTTATASTGTSIRALSTVHVRVRLVP